MAALCDQLALPNDSQWDQATPPRAPPDLYDTRRDMQSLLSKSRHPELLLACVEAAELGGGIAREHFLHSQKIRTKADTSVVTDADVRAEEAIREFLSTRFQGIGFEGEETGISGEAEAIRWRVDPIDGTDNYVSGIPYFATTVALVSEKECICGASVNPITREVFAAEKGLGAYLNEKQILNNNGSLGRRSRVAFIPDYTTKGDMHVKQILQNLRDSVFRVIDSWAPSLDWCSLASGRFDAILQVSCTAAVPNIGYLLASEAGMHISYLDYATKSSTVIKLVLASPTSAGCQHLEKICGLG